MVRVISLGRKFNRQSISNGNATTKGRTARIGSGPNQNSLLCWARYGAFSQLRQTAATVGSLERPLVV